MRLTFPAVLHFLQSPAAVPGHLEHETAKPREKRERTFAFVPFVSFRGAFRVPNFPAARTRCPGS